MIHSTKAGTVERYFKFGREGRGGGGLTLGSKVPSDIFITGVVPERGQGATLAPPSGKN